LTLVSTQPQDTLEKEEPDKKSSSTLNHDQSMLLNTTALKKVIE